MGLQISGNDGLDTLIQPAQISLMESLQDAVSFMASQPAKPGAGEDNPAVLVFVKTTAIDSVALDIAAQCPTATTVVSLQNGVDNSTRLLAGAPKMTVLAGVVAFNVVWRSANHVHQTNNGSLIFQQDPASEEFAPAFRLAGLPLELSRDMEAIKWGKLLVNLLNPVNALSNVPLRDVLLQRDFRRVLAALTDEGLRALNAAGIRPAKIGDAPPPKLFSVVLRSPNWLFVRLASKAMRMDPAARASMCEDLQNGKPTEVDDLCGAVVRLGRLHGVATPLNQIMCDLIHQYQPGQSWSGQRLLAALNLR
jgi:2-dehydropantoate 2-reductase